MYLLIGLFSLLVLTIYIPFPGLPVKNVIFYNFMPGGGGVNPHNIFTQLFAQVLFKLDSFNSHYHSTAGVEYRNSIIGPCQIEKII